MTGPLPSLDVILVNRNSGALLERCVASLAVADRSGFTLGRVRVVDDLSTDGSADGLDPAGLPLEVVKNERRLGYGASCNRGAAGSAADYLLFLNTDIELEQGALGAPVRFMQQAANARVGMVGIQLLDPDGSVWRSCSRFPHLGTFFAMMLGLDKVAPRRFRNILMTEWDHATTREVDQVMGAFLLMRRAVFEELGGYDERFFVYMEDLDLTLRANRAGWTSMYITDARAVHLGGGTARRVWSESLFFFARSRVQYGFKHFGVARGLLLAAGTLAVEPFLRLGYYLARGSASDARAALTAYARLWAWVLSGAAAGRG